jgi:hypothetical protein
MERTVLTMSVPNIITVNMMWIVPALVIMIIVRVLRGRGDG